MRRNKSRGIALIIAIWMLAILLVLLAGFAAMVHSDAQIARNFGEMTRARWAAHAGVVRGEAELKTLATLPYTSFDGESQLTINSTDEDVQLGNASYQTVIEDEAGKININTAPVEILTMFFSTDVADAIIDWRDADSTPEAEGAEDDYYTGLSAPYHCKNAPFTTVDELLLVKGVTREMLDTQLTDDGPTLAEILTVSSTDANTTADGQTRVNIATADKDAITNAVGDALTPEEIDAIIQQRTSSAFTSPADLLRVQNLGREKVAQVYDLFTTSTAQNRPGLVNINTASVVVLAALPGMDEATAQAIVEYRTNQGPFENVGQLLSVDQMSDETFMRVADLLTMRSQVFRVIATGGIQDGNTQQEESTAKNITQTVTCVFKVESTSGEATTRILYWRE